MKKIMKIHLMLLLLALPFLGWQMPARAAEMDMLACTPKAGGTEEGNFSLKTSENIQFSCAVTNPTEAEFSGMLLGRQFFGAQVQSISSSDIKIGKGGKSEVDLQFPAVFVSGSYRFTFVVMDSKTKGVASKEVALTGVVGGEEQPSIANASIAEGEYRWGDTFTMTLSLATPQGKALENKTVTFDAVVLDQNGQACGSIVSDQTVVQASDVYQLKFPDQVDCSNALLVTLKNRAGTVIDKKTIAVNISVVPDQSVANQPVAESATESKSNSLTTFMVVILGIVVLIAIIFGYFIVKRRV